MTTTDRLAEIEARLSAATPGPWIAEYSGEQGNCVIPSDAQSTREAVCVTRLYHQQADAELIAHAPADLAALVAVVREVEALHRPDESRGTWDGYCRSCGKEWPCPTAAAVQTLGEAS